MLVKAAFTMILFVTASAHAHQAVDVGEPLNPPKAEAKWVEESDTVDIDGDIGALKSDARKNWQAACDNWKREFREDNKGSRIINISCGDPTCSGDVGSKTCHSKATYKMKTKED